MSKARKKLSFEERLASLNEAQRKAVETTEGPVMVIAGPGSGKTELLAIRIASILKKGLASPSQVLCLTFTDNAAINMRERLETLLGKDAYRVSIFTFHSFCNHIISRYPEYFYNEAHFTLANDVVRASILEKLFKELPHKHVFSSFHPQEGFVYLRDVRDRIKHIKSGGYTPKEFALLIAALSKEYEAINKVLKNYPEGRMSIKRIGEINPLLEKLSALKSTTATLLSKTLTRALEECATEGKTEPLGTWKKKYTATTEDDQLVLKDAHALQKIEALVELYSAYEDKMHEEGYYDYDDMIIDVSHALKHNKTLRAEIEEQYQYILIDEFQDTNEAQMNLVKAITSGDIHEGKPNVLVVGDDDQAIYKFQGAELSNMIGFRSKDYKDVTTVVLDKNYRSTKEILSFARNVITQGSYRLENHFEDIQKELSAMNEALPKGEINVNRFQSDIEEYSFISKKISDLIKEGASPSSIAILSRGHRELKAMLPFLDSHQIPYEYIKRANVFDEPHIQQLITIAKYLSSILAHEHTADYLLPEILSYPFWNIERKDIFNLALLAKQENISWLEAAEKSDSKEVQGFFELMLLFHKEAGEMPLPHFLDFFMEKSGFKEYYFSKQELKDSPSTYVYFLASLKTFIEGLREHKEGEQLSVADVGPFVSLHKEHDIPLVSQSVYTKSEDAVQLMTAHAAKGLEFSYVFIISTHDALWTKAPRANKVPLPSVLAPLLTPAGDTEDDFIRLLYVAITRAKHSLFISAHDDVVRYIAQETADTITSHITTKEDHEKILGIIHTPFKVDEEAILKKLVEEYTMPVTHFNNFLNVVEGGPLYFIEQNLLRFPQPMNPSAVLGSAVHKGIEELVLYPKFNGGEIPTKDHILSLFNKTFSKGRLPKEEHVKHRKRGEEVITAYYKEHKNDFLPTDEIEVDMKHEGVVIDGAHIVGKIDFLRKEKDGLRVIDWKTGDALTSWEETGLSDYQKIKLHHYKTQLIFYKLLLENSSTYKGTPVTTLELEFVEDMFTLSYTPTIEEIDRTTKLISIVFEKIKSLDFPNTDSYEKTYKGIRAFEDDLLKQ
jgi:DNA helicase-2/ATP-dependent DNA helicase PcrA